MPIEIYGSDAAGHLMLMPDPTPERTPGATAPPEGEPALPGMPEAPAEAAAPPPPEDELAALRRLVEAREASDRTRELRDAQRDAQLDTVTRVLSGQAPAVPETPPAGPQTRPTAEAFDTHEAFVEAVADWKAEEKVGKLRQEQQQERQQTAQQQAMWTRDQVVRQAEEAFVTAHPDYIEVVQRGLVAKTPQAFRQLIMLTDDAPAVAYAIAQDEALLGRLMQMPPQQLFYALGRLSGQHGGSAPPPAPAAGGLPPGGAPPPAPHDVGRPKPPPPRPLSGTGVAPVGGFRDDMSMAEYRQWKKQHTLG